jgi:hypothetical protein
VLITDLGPEPEDPPTVVLPALDVDQADAAVWPEAQHVAAPGSDFWTTHPDAVRVGGAARHAARGSW